MSLILLAVAVVHAPLLMMELPLKSYDTNFHIFFASHYLHHWFNPWNPKWYAGFSQTTYPPLPQQWVAILSHIFGLDMGYMVVQFIAILLLAIGVYRFSLLWVNERAASIAALASVFLGSESFLVYCAGQLGTTSAAPIYLNGLPYMYEYLRFGSKRSFLKATVLFAAAAVAHHATLLFGSIFFALPILALVFFDKEHGERIAVPTFVMRTVVMGVVIVTAIVIVLLPFWIALLRYPVTQTPIPHASRANYLLSPNWGINYFVVPYGAIILAFPFIFLRGSAVARLRPLLIGFWIAFLCGIGGTTPAAHIILGRAFEVLTMERFSYWATLLALPFVGLLTAELYERFKLKAVVGVGIAAALSCALGAAWSTILPPDSQQLKVESAAAWLSRDGHNQYRYVTLGFGNKLALLGRLADADSVDGEWNSGRMLPELTEYGSGALNNSKGFGEAGLDALRAMLNHADHYGLKWVLVHDHYYDPLLSFAGWRPVDSLEDRTITIWGKDGIPPATPLNAPQMPPAWQGLMWGILPVGCSLLAILVVLIPPKKRDSEDDEEYLSTKEDRLVHGGIAS